MAGSIILAGVLLKLGGYGLIRSLALGYKMVIKSSYYLVGLSLFGMIYVGILCCRLNDLKALVAYSSVAHMAIVVRGCAIIRCLGVFGALVIIIGHGLSSSGLFCVVNIFYERFSSRSFYLNKGLILILPIFTFIIFILVARNIAAPPSVNLFSEILLMSRIISYDVFMFMTFPLGSFLGAVFSVFIYSFTQHGKLYSAGLSFVSPSLREYHCLLMHILPLNFLVLNAPLLLSVCSSSLCKITVCGSVEKFYFLSK